MIQVEVTGFIDAPREKVWEVYTDHATFWSFTGSAMACIIAPRWTNWEKTSEPFSRRQEHPATRRSSGVKAGIAFILK